jgi:dTDP-4-amino-4,6-dideoxygalactose transaminase
MARGWTDRLAEFRERRRANAECWQRLEAAGGFRACFPEKGEDHDLLRYPLEIFDGFLRDQLLKAGSRLGLGIAPGYPDSIDGIVELHDDFRGQSYPQAKGLANRLVTLPLHPLLSAKDRVRIEDLLKQEKGMCLCR